MDIKQLTSLYSVILDYEILDHVTTLVAGKTTKELKTELIHKQNQQSDELLLDTLIKEYEYKDDSQRYIAKLLLRNELEYININCPLASNKSLLMNIAAKTVKLLMVFNDIISIQPLSISTGIVYQLSYTFDKDEQQVDPITNPSASQTRRMRLEVIANRVEAVTHDLQAGWTIEVMQDLRARNKIDLESELSIVMAGEIAHEISNDILHDLVTLANQNPASATITNNDEQFYTANQSTSIIHHINRAASAIAKGTRRGRGNIIITTPLGVAMLQSCVGIKFISVVDGFISPFSIGLVGYLTTDPNGNPESAQYKVYSTVSSSLQSNNADEVKFLITYRGMNSIDTGYIYVPYVPVMSSGIEIDPMTFQPLVRLKTRAGKWTKWFKREDELTSIETSNIGKSSDYFVLLTTTNKDLSI